MMSSSTVTAIKATCAGEYNVDAPPSFAPMSWSMREIRSIMPPHLFVRRATTGILYLARDILMATMAWLLATYIDPVFKSDFVIITLTPQGAEFARWCSWSIYWWFQGLIFTGIWVIGHECGHGAFSDHRIINDIVGFRHTCVHFDHVALPAALSLPRLSDV